MRQPLSNPLPSNITYDAIEIERPTYDPMELRYTARVYGVCRGEVMPLIVSTAVAVRRVEDVIITDAEIDRHLDSNPTGNRVQAALEVAFARLYHMASETPEHPYVAP